MELATTNEIPADVRAVHFVFETDQGECTVTIDKFQEPSLFYLGLPQMTSNAIGSVIATGRNISDFKTYFVK